MLLLIFGIIIIIIILVYNITPNLHLKNTIIPFYSRRDSIFPKIKKLKEVTIFCSSGLSNRIRTILGFLAVCKRFNKTLNVIWISDNTCNGNFTDYFEGINNVNFLEHKIEPIHYVGQNTIKNICDNYDIDVKESELYSNIKLKKHVENKLNIFVNKYDIENTVGIHVRRTDYTGNFIGKLLNGSNEDEIFFNFIDKYSFNKPFFIATDNSETQKNFRKKYKDRMLVYSKIEDTDCLRKTSLENAILDIFILSKCKKIKGTFKSSFTEFAINLKRSYRRKLI